MDKDKLENFLKTLDLSVKDLRRAVNDANPNPDEDGPISEPSLNPQQCGGGWCCRGGCRCCGGENCRNCNCENCRPCN